MPPDRDPFFAFPSLYGAPAYARPPTPVAEVARPFDPDEFPLAAEQSEEESTVMRELGLVGRYQQRRAMAIAEPPRPNDASASAIPTRRLSLRVFAGRLRMPGS